MNAARTKPQAPRSPYRGSVGTQDETTGWLAAIAIASLAARFLLPTEASVDGETLWLVQLWILAAAVWAWRQVLRGRPMVRFDLGTLAVGLLVAGHLISAVVLFSRGGDKRAAVNVVWEWVSLGLTFLIVRSVIAERGARRTVIWAITCVGVSLAGLGVYQHFVQFPRTAEEYRANRAEFDELQKSMQSGTSSQQYARLTRSRELHRWFVQHEIPIEGPARQQWEARALSSTEPFGTFGLANTLAGLLVVFLFPAIAFAVAIWRDKQHPALTSRLVAVGIVLLLAACLILTKSRTAWVGGVAGGFVWWWFRQGDRHSGRKWIGWTAAGLFATVAIAVAAALTGGLDRQVLSESPKSLRYRWQYWSGTVGVLEELPLFGPGPGNFRQRYLKHKLPESSEEIRDPHNLLLDVWCNGGVIALAGLLLLFAWCVRGLRKRGPPATLSNGDSPSEDVVRAGTNGIIAGFLLVVLYLWFLDADDGGFPRLWGLLAGSLAAWLLTRRRLRTTELSTACLAGGAAALAVHLLGAGGIEMPAITQTLLLLCAALVPSRDESAGTIPVDHAGLSRRGFVTATAVTAAAAILFGTCLSTATIRVLTRQSVSTAGRALWQSEPGRIEEAERLLTAAAANDPLSPVPTRELSQIAFVRWQKSPQRKPLLDRAIELQKVAIRLDPHHYQGYWTLGLWYGQRYEKFGQKPEDLTAALDAFNEAVERYPNKARLLADQTRLLVQAGQPATADKVARRALELDDVNHSEGHTDKVLSGEIRQRLLTAVRKSKGKPESVNRN